MSPICGGNVAAAGWSVLSLNREANVWRTACKASAFKIYRFLEVYSENCSQLHRLWRHEGRASARAPRRFASVGSRPVDSGLLWLSAAFLERLFLGMTAGPARPDTAGRPQLRLSQRLVH